MQIVINIDKGDYEMLKVLKSCGGRLHKSDLRILNGTPLPEKHGRLIDADALECDSFNRIFDDYAFSIIDDTPTIIESER